MPEHSSLERLRGDKGKENVAPTTRGRTGKTPSKAALVDKTQLDKNPLTQRKRRLQSLLSVSKLGGPARASRSEARFDEEEDETEKPEQERVAGKGTEDDDTQGSVSTLVSSLSVSGNSTPRVGLRPVAKPPLISLLEDTGEAASHDDGARSGSDSGKSQSSMGLLMSLREARRSSRHHNSPSGHSVSGHSVSGHSVAGHSRRLPLSLSSAISMIDSPPSSNSSVCSLGGGNLTGNLLSRLTTSNSPPPTETPLPHPSQTPSLSVVTTALSPVGPVLGSSRSKLFASSPKTSLSFSTSPKTYQAVSSAVARSTTAKTSSRLSSLESPSAVVSPVPVIALAPLPPTPVASTAPALPPVVSVAPIVPVVAPPVVTPVVSPVVTHAVAPVVAPVAAPVVAPVATPASVAPPPVSSAAPSATPSAPSAVRSAPPSAAPSAARSVASVSSSKPDRREKDEAIIVNGKVYFALELIGQGGSSKVYRVLSKDKKVYALKRIAIGGEANHVANYHNEIALLQRMKGRPYVIQLIDSQEDLVAGVIYMVFELGTMDFAHFLQTSQASKTWDNNSIRYYWKQILECTQMCHDEKIIHLDLKPPNFVLVEGCLKLIDFGIAKEVAADATSILNENNVGTLDYMSPESVVEHSPNPRERGHKLGRSSDVWSLGCILYQMVYGNPPLRKFSMVQKMRALMDPHFAIPFGPCADSALLQVMKSCLQYNPKDRPTIAELLVHPYLAPKQDVVSGQHIEAILSQLGVLEPAKMTKGILAQIQAGQAVDLSKLMKKTTTLSSRGLDPAAD